MSATKSNVLDLKNFPKPVLAVETRWGEKKEYDPYALADSLAKVSKEKGDAITYDDLREVYGAPKEADAKDGNTFTPHELNLIRHQMEWYLEDLSDPKAVRGGSQNSPASTTSSRPS